MNSSAVKSSRSERKLKSTPAQRRLWRDAARKRAAMLKKNGGVTAKNGSGPMTMSTLVLARKVKKLVIDRIKATSNLPELEMTAWTLAEELLRNETVR